MNLGLAGLGSSITMKPLGDISLNSNLGVTGIWIGLLMALTTSALLMFMRYKNLLGRLDK